MAKSDLRGPTYISDDLGVTCVWTEAQEELWPTFLIVPSHAVKHRIIRKGRQVENMTVFRLDMPRDLSSGRQLKDSKVSAGLRDRQMAATEACSKESEAASGDPEESLSRAIPHG